MLFLLVISIFITLIITIIYNCFFSNKIKINNRLIFKNVGITATSLTEINLLFGIISFKNENNEEKNVACYSYRNKIKKGQRVLITDYDIEKQLYIVDEYPRV